MGTLYRFTVQGTCSRCGKLGAVRGGSVFGEYTLLDALLWAIGDLLTPGREPFLVVSDGEIFFSAAKVRVAAGVPEPAGECRCYEVCDGP